MNGGGIPRLGNLRTAQDNHALGAKYVLTVNVLQRTYQLQHKGALGTCFTIDVDRKQYLVTAKHCLDDFDPTDFQLFHDGQWKHLNVSLVGYGTHNADIAVLKADQQLSPDFPLEPSLSNVVLGQDAYFLGFPYGLRSEAGNINRSFPLPLVKSCIISAIQTFGRDLQEVLLDGHNNPGFSGGPVVFSPLGNASPNYQVGAVISAYRFQPEEILHQDQPTGLVYRSNTGIVICHSIKHATDAIGKNPIGFDLGTPQQGADPSNAPERRSRRR